MAAEGVFIVKLLTFGAGKTLKIAPFVQAIVPLRKRPRTDDATKAIRSAPLASNVEGSGIAVMVKVLPLNEELPNPPVPLKVKPVMERLFVV